MNNIELVQYSEKAIAVFGETKPVKDDLKRMGGKFNKYLTNPHTGSKQAGWVFQTKHRDMLQAFVDGQTIGGAIEPAAAMIRDEQELNPAYIIQDRFGATVGRGF